jgi:hypothetical protein
MDREDGPVAIIPPRHRQSELEHFVTFQQRRRLTLHLGHHLGVIALCGHLQQLGGVCGVLGELVPRCDLFTQGRKVLHDGLRRLWVIPDVRLRGGFFQPRYLSLFARDVKDASASL